MVVDQAGMARFRRTTAPGSIQHVISRFVNREFRLVDDAERSEYLQRLSCALAATDWRALSYGLMSNHVHHGTLAGLDASDRLMRPLHSGFARWLNRRQGRLGPVFAERHMSIVVPSEATARLIAYHHNNPVRAGVVADPADSGWTSHRAYIGEVVAPPWLDVKLGLKLCGFDGSPTGRLRFHEFVCSHSGDAKDDELSGNKATVRRASARAKSGAPLEAATPEIDAESRCRVPMWRRNGTVLRPRWEGEALDVLREACVTCGVSMGAVRGRSRQREVVRTRKIALAAWSRCLGRAQVDMAAVLGICTGAASKLVRSAMQSADLRRVAEGVADAVRRPTRSTI